MGSLIAWSFRQTCTVKPHLRVANGKDIYGPEEQRPCRIQNGAHLRHTYKNPSGVLDQKEARATMYCEGDKIPPRSVVICDGESYIVIDSYAARGLNGVHHWEVYLQ